MHISDCLCCRLLRLSLLFTLGLCVQFCPSLFRQNLYFVGRRAASVNLHHSNKETLIQFITFFRSSSSSLLFVIFLRYTTKAGLWRILFSHNPHVKMSQQKPSSLPQCLSQFPAICFKILIGHERNGPSVMTHAAVIKYRGQEIKKEGCLHPERCSFLL